MTIISPNVAACQEAIELLSHPQPRYQIQRVESLERLRELWEIDKEAYKDCSLEFEPFVEWWNRYECGSRNLLENDRIVASIGLYPLYAEQYQAFVNGWIKESALKPVTLTECEEEPVSTWYSSGIVVAEHARGWGSPLPILLNRGIRSWLDSGHLRYPLDLIAIAEYDEGARLLELFGFEKIRDKAEMPDGCDLYQVRFANRNAAIAQLRQRMSNG